MNVKTINPLNETGALLFDEMSELGTLTVYNAHASATLFIKIFYATEAPTYASAVPDLVFPCAAGVSNFALFAGLPPCFVQASADAGAGATAPGEDPIVTYSYRVS